jgi:hypothetical protein
MTENTPSAKITVTSYCHEAHKCWIPFWAEQLNKQEFRDFDILFICHNWTGIQWSEGVELMKIMDEKLDDDLRDRFQWRWHESPPVIGDVIDFAASQVKTEFMAHHDLDDIIHPKRLLLQSRFLDVNPDTDFLGTRMVGFTGEPAPEMLELNYVQPNEPNLNVTEHLDIYRTLLHKQQNCLGHTTMIYRPEVLQALGGFSRSDVKLDGKSPDFETWKKALMAGYKFHRLPQLCALWRLDSSSIRS